MDKISYLCERCNRFSSEYCMLCTRGNMFVERDRTNVNTDVRYDLYCKGDWKPTSDIFKDRMNKLFTIKNVIFSEPATIVMWADGTKTVVKCQEGDIYDPEKGLAMAVVKKALGNKGNYNEVFKKWLPKEENE